MADLGLSLVRIGEFSWSRLEATPDELNWQWLDDAIGILGDAGLRIILGTPTATPPHWMLQRHPDMLAVDKYGRPRKFGSRRHYCFSYLPYWEEAQRIARLMAERYAQHPALEAWQIDNESGCHDTVLSYSEAARQQFHTWLSKKYRTIESLNQAWGNTFWSMEYAAFGDVGLPNLTVTEPNPSHALDFKRFSSDQVIAYNRVQVDAIREFSNAPLIHNYMGRITDFDHYKLGDDLEIASWDSYPLGFLVDRSGAADSWKKRFHRQGDPDFQALHHDLYRAVGKGRWWVMEQQPGPVNWAPNNPAPLDGMVRLWTWEAFAHEAEAVCYFRWRQAPFAQEQMHAGILRPDSQPALAHSEIAQVVSELAQLSDLKAGRAKVGLVFDYESCWAWQVQPQGAGFDYFSIVFDFYKGLRRLGLSIDILRPDSQNIADYSLVVAPGLMTWPAGFLQQLESASTIGLLGPRSGSKTPQFTIPESLPPSIANMDCQVEYVETLANDTPRAMQSGGHAKIWCESLATTEQVLEYTEDGTPALIAKNQMYYLGVWPDQIAMERILLTLGEHAKLKICKMPEGVRLRCTSSHEFIFNHNAESVEFRGETMQPAEVKISPLI